MLKYIDETPHISAKKQKELPGLTNTNEAFLVPVTIELFNRKLLLITNNAALL